MWQKNDPITPKFRKNLNFLAEKLWENIQTYFQKFSVEIFGLWSKNSWIYKILTQFKKTKQNKFSQNRKSWSILPVKLFVTLLFFFFFLWWKDKNHFSICIKLQTGCCIDFILHTCKNNCLHAVKLMTSAMIFFLWLINLTNCSSKTHFEQVVSCSGVAVWTEINIPLRLSFSYKYCTLMVNVRYRIFYLWIYCIGDVYGYRKKHIDVTFWMKAFRQFLIIKC